MKGDPERGRVPVSHPGVTDFLFDCSGRYCTKVLRKVQNKRHCGEEGGVRGCGRGGRFTL